MISIKLKLKPKSNSEGKHAIVLQLLKNREKKIIATGLSVKIEQWDETEHCFKTRHPNAMQNNRLLDTIKIKARNIISDFELSTRQTVSARPNIVMTARALPMLEDCPIAEGFSSERINPSIMSST